VAAELGLGRPTHSHLSGRRADIRLIGGRADDLKRLR
jgi:hypothetical protein